MRTTIFTSGLILATAVLAAPAPRPQQGNDISDSNPFDITKRLDVPDLDLPALPSADSLTSKLPLKLPTVLRRALDSIYGAVPVTTVATTAEDTVVDRIPVKLSTLSIKARQLSGLTSTVTSTAGPVIDIAKPLLSSLLTSLISVDSQVQSLISGVEKDVDIIVSTLESDLSGAVDEIQSLTSTLGSDASGAVDEMKTLVSEVETLAGTLVKDLEKLESSLPSVSSLIATVEGIIAGVQGLGL